LNHGISEEKNSYCLRAGAMPGSRGRRAREKRGAHGVSVHLVRFFLPLSFFLFFFATKINSWLPLAAHDTPDDLITEPVSRRGVPLSHVPAVALIGGLQSRSA